MQQKVDKTTGNDQLIGWTRKKLQNTSKAKLAPNKEVVITVWWSATGLIHYSFLNPGKTITSDKQAQQIDEMHRKVQSMQLALVNRKDPILPHYNA